MRRRPSSALILALAAIPAVAAAQQSALRNHNGNAPVDVDADRLEVQDRADRAVFSGNVRVRQGELRLDAPRVTVAYANQGGNTQVDRMDASGGVKLVSPTETATGNFAIYDVNRRLITMLGNVTLTHAGSTVRGGRLVIDLTSGRASIDGNTSRAAPAPGTPGEVQQSGGRVSGHFSVRQQPQGAPAQ